LGEFLGRAREIIQVVALAIKSNIMVKDLGEELFPYLTMADRIKLCVLMFYKDITQLMLRRLIGLLVDWSPFLNAIIAEISYKN